MTTPLKVFLSSTSKDLRKHRKQLLFTFAQLHQWTEAMEFFGARPGSPLEECLEALGRADIYVVVVGMRYGSKAGQDISFTQREYEEAIRLGKPVLAYEIDQKKHKLAPRFVDTGDDARRLEVFKQKLGAHVKALFRSPADLALKVGMDLIRETHTPVAEERAQQFASRMPVLMAAAGYSPGLSVNSIDVSQIFETRPGMPLRFKDPTLQSVVVAGHLATQLSRGHFEVLNGILTFDREFWVLLVALSRCLGINGEQLAAAIRGSSMDPMRFRLLIKLAGALPMDSCAEAICNTFLERRYLDKSFVELRQMATPMRSVIREALESMSPGILPAVELYLRRAQELQRWQQKQVFSAVVESLRLKATMS
jgi:hypothetical protein